MNKNFSGTAIVVVKPFIGENSKPDVNGVTPVFLKVIAGKSPNRTILNGTVAQVEGLEEGGAYLVSITEVESHPEHGRQFQWSRIAEMSALEIIDADNKLGKVQIFDVSEDTASKELKDIKSAEKNVMS